MSSTDAPVTPNRRGARSRESVLDAAERLMAAQGYDAATIAALVEEAGLPASSIYHYFGSKEGVLLAVMERGAGRFFASLPSVDDGEIEPAVFLRDAADALERNPDFLRILIVTTAQSGAGATGAGGATETTEVDAVVERVRELARERLREWMGVVFGVDPGGPEADHLARFALAAFDGAFVARQSNPELEIAELLAHLPAALAAVHAELEAGASS